MNCCMITCHFEIVPEKRKEQEKRMVRTERKRETRARKGKRQVKEKARALIS